VSPLDDDAEIERLRGENRALDDQVKLLVQTEQRLYRFQSDLDTQLARIQALAAFALESISLQRSGEILARALNVLHEAFVLDWAGAVRVRPDADEIRLLRAQPRPSGDPPFLEMLPEIMEWARALSSSLVIDAARDRGLSPAWALFGAIAPEAARVAAAGRGRLAVVPMHSHDRVVQGVLVAWSAPRSVSSPRPTTMTEREVPFLDLLGRHTGRAVESAILSDDLRRRGEELAASIANLQKAQEALVQSRKLEAIGRLAGGVAHDFNNLLTVILGYAETLDQELADDPIHRADVRQILAAGHHAADITRQLLAFGRRQMHRPEPLDLGALVQRTAGVLRRLVGENVTVELRLDPRLANVQADRSQVEQIVLNLLVNARDAMPAGGRISVTTRAVDAHDLERVPGVDPARFAVLEVSDPGVGMDAETRAQVFEPFFTTKDGASGTGLGLAVVYGIVRQSDGEVYVESEPGRGSRFTILLPFAPNAVDSDPTGVAIPTPSHHARRILLAEDEPMIRDLFAETLRGAGHTVIDAPDGATALDLAGAANAIDVLVTDVRMPGMTGLELAERLREHRPGLEVLLVSGHAMEMEEGGRARLPDAAFLSKPIVLQALLDEVERLGGRAAREERTEATETAAT